MQYNKEIFELDPARAMQKETRQLFDHSAALAETIVDSQGEIVELDPSTNLESLPPNISGFLTFEMKHRALPVMGIRVKRSKMSSNLEMDVFVSDNRFGGTDDTMGSYVRVFLSPDSVQVSAWSSQDPISKDGLDFVHKIRDGVSGATKAERDIANYTVALPIVDFIANTLF
jgi:hypothetical protein